MKQNNYSEYRLIFFKEIELDVKYINFYRRNRPYTELYNLLGTDGLKLSQKVMAAIMLRKTGKSTKTLTGQEKIKLKEVLSEEHRRILESENECDTSFHVSYGLHQIYLDKAQSPKSGWGIPVKGKDIGIGDDVERLNRIQTINSKISNPETLSVTTLDCWILW